MSTSTPLAPLEAALEAAVAASWQCAQRMEAPDASGDGGVAAAMNAYTASLRALVDVTDPVATRTAQTNAPPSTATLLTPVPPEVCCVVVVISFSLYFVFPRSLAIHKHTHTHTHTHLRTPIRSHTYTLTFTAALCG
jgi:hypothetical protein